MDAIGRMAESLEAVMAPLVEMIVARVSPLQDDISLHAARRDYGSAWVTRHIERGNLKFRTKGQRRVLSRAKLELLRAAEIQDAKII